MNSTPEYSVPTEAGRIFQGLFRSPFMQHLPDEAHRLRHLIRFEGKSLPSIPFVWRWAESIAALKALEATMVNVLAMRKYGTAAMNVIINTDHASLFIFSPHLAKIISEDERGPTKLDPNTLNRIPKEEDFASGDSLFRLLATGLYKTADSKYYHIHGALNPDRTLGALALPLDAPSTEPLPTLVARIQSAVIRFSASSLDSLMNAKHRQAGTIVHTESEYVSTPHYIRSQHEGLYTLHHSPCATQTPGWWASSPSLPSSNSRPLAGLKVLDLTRVIAGPTITRGLAELGASVMRVTGPGVPDLESMFRDLNWGKWNCILDLKTANGKETLKKLVSQADVVVDGYRPGVMRKLGFDVDEIFKIVKGRGRGIVVARINCYGWEGEWKDRSGWQGISDACCGISTRVGESMKLPDGEPVTPPFPNSDHCTGVAGTTGILHALIERAKHGGNWRVDPFNLSQIQNPNPDPHLTFSLGDMSQTSLNAYNHFLLRVGTYPPAVWTHLWESHNRPVFRHTDNTRITVPKMLSLLRKFDADVLFKDEFFEERRSECIGAVIRRVKGVAQYEGTDAVKLTFNVGTRPNGSDSPRWPEDLTTEIVR